MDPMEAEDTGDMEGEEGDGEQAQAEPQPEVVCTVMCNPDGTYTLISGDEPDQAAAGAAAQGGDMGEAADLEGPPGEQFDSVGSLLKGVLEIVKTYEANKSGEGSADDNFNAGYTGGSAASPMKPSLA